MKKFFLSLLVTVMVLAGTVSCGDKDEDNTLQNLVLLVLFQQQSEAQAKANAIAQHPACTSAITASSTSQNLVKAGNNNEAMVIATLTSGQSLVFTGVSLPGGSAASSWGIAYSGDPCSTGTFTQYDSFTITDSSDRTTLTLTPSTPGTYSFEYSYSFSSVEAASIQ